MTTAVQVLIGPEELAAMLHGGGPVVLIDTRPPAEYDAGHLPGAVNVHEMFSHFAFSTPAGMEELHRMFQRLLGEAGLGADEHAVVYEEAMDAGYGQSCRGYVLLRYLGHQRVSVLHGGKRAWDAVGLPVTTERPSPVPKPFPLRVDPSVLVSTEEVRAVLDDPSVVKLDVRDYPEWAGQTASPGDVVPCPRTGRLPGAVWIEWLDLMTRHDDVPMFRSPEEIREICGRVGIGPDTTVYAYCLAGIRASNTYLALQLAGITDVRVYLGSWFEWSRDPSCPVDDDPLDEHRMARPVP